MQQDAEAQARRCFAIAAAAIESLGGGVEHVVRTRMYITDASVSDAVGRAHRAYFGAYPAAATMVVAGLFDPRWVVEIEVDALLDG